MHVQVHALATSMAVQVTLDPDVRGGSSSASEALALAEALCSVQREIERLKSAEVAAQKLASDLQVSKITLIFCCARVMLAVPMTAG